MSGGCVHSHSHRGGRSITIYFYFTEETTDKRELCAVSVFVCFIFILTTGTLFCVKLCGVDRAHYAPERRRDLESSTITHTHKHTHRENFRIFRITFSAFSLRCDVVVVSICGDLAEKLVETILRSRSPHPRMAGWLQVLRVILVSTRARVKRTQHSVPVTLIDACFFCVWPE